MTSITGLAEAEAVLAKYVPLSKEITGKNITLDRMQSIMAVLDNPQRRLKIIHIAGTSGKTSTAYYIANLLKISGKKTGLTVSPHVDSVLERVQVNMQQLSEAEFGATLAECIDLIEAANIQPTYFELLVAYAYWYFAKINVDYAVVETGMGGLQDGTNIANNSDKLCIITDIGLDHMQVLGNTVPQIARQKAGIIHEGNTVVMYRQPDEVMDVFTDWCREVKAHIEIHEQSTLAADQLLPAELNALPEYQRRNWLLSLEAYKLLVERGGLPPLTTAQLIESMHVQVPGRMDQRQIGSKTIIMDGAHNEQKMQAFVASVAERLQGRKVPVLLSLKEGKEFAAVLPLLKPITTTLIITAFEGRQDLPTASIESNELGHAAEKFSFDSIIIEPDQEKALQLLLAQSEDVGIITGSFYLLGQLRNSHPELKNA